MTDPEIAKMHEFFDRAEEDTKPSRSTKQLPKIPQGVSISPPKNFTVPPKPGELHKGPTSTGETEETDPKNLPPEIQPTVKQDFDPNKRPPVSNQETRQAPGETIFINSKRTDDNS